MAFKKLFTSKIFLFIILLVLFILFLFLFLKLNSPTGYSIRLLDESKEVNTPTKYCVYNVKLNNNQYIDAIFACEYNKSIGYFCPTDLGSKYTLVIDNC
ncbi:MAG: hypothetical protein WCY27_00490 [archaeon]|jgi:hypothetical protein|nr:hypothetical protein [archaeon]MDD2477667.1 hypothetical protein [Candidatus ainarchaeum sp.]MDD3084393.1 hypothetical protein [Candidatus ainarchaeum sp.]MDD4220849.1 hypothetical protein [Candidatus ainarchaeum sp.]MDD4662349.1 hypothetical protein [Candidatus ainarchaeum sp.]